MARYIRKTQPRYAAKVMGAAVKAVCSGMTLRKASNDFGIPKKTLETHVKRAKLKIPIRVKGGYIIYNTGLVPPLDESDAGPVSEPKIKMNKPSVVRQNNPKRSCRSTSKGCPAVAETKEKTSLLKKKADKENEENSYSDGKLTDDTLSFVTMIGVKLDRMTRRARLATQMRICKVVFESELNSLENE